MRFPVSPGERSTLSSGVGVSEQSVVAPAVTRVAGPDERGRGAVPVQRLIPWSVPVLGSGEINTRDAGETGEGWKSGVY